MLASKQHRTPESVRALFSSYPDDRSLPGTIYRDNRVHADPPLHDGATQREIRMTETKDTLISAYTAEARAAAAAGTPHGLADVCAVAHKILLAEYPDMQHDAVQGGWYTEQSQELFSRYLAEVEAALHAAGLDYDTYNSTWVYRTQTEYMWKEWSKDEQSYCTPQSDPMVFEYPIDFVFEDPDKARAFLSDRDLEEEAAENKWVLVKVTYEPVETR